jgi:hypothetical protein
MLNGHGLPDHWRASVITHLSPGGKAELIWPAFVYGSEQANAEVLDHTVVFTAALPDRSLVLMARREGEPPMVITEAVLRLAAKRLGTSVIVPNTDYYFIKVRQPPERLWLQGQPLASANAYPPKGVFTLELSAEDLRQVIDDTRRRGKPMQANKFAYFAEADPIRLSSQDAGEIAKAGFTPLATNAAVIRKISGYQPRNEDLYGDVLLDASNHYAYFVSHHEPGRILKVALGADPRTPPQVVGVAVLEGNEDNPFNNFGGAQAGHGYFGTTFPAQLVKVAFGESNAPPYRVSSVMIDPDENIGSGMLDLANGYGYFQVGQRLVKIRLGQGDAPSVMVSAMELPAVDGVRSLGPGLLDPVNHCAYYGTDWRKIHQVALGDGDAPPRLLNSLTIDGEEHPGSGGFIDVTNRCAWFISSNGDIYKVALGGAGGSMRYLGKLNLGHRYQYLMHAFGMDDAGYIYLGTMGGGRTGDPECCAGGVMKIALGKGDELPRIASFLALSDEVNISEGVVDALNRMLYLGVTVAASGCKVMKIKLGEGDAPPEVTAETKLYLK